jgi:hypothetical protein
MPREILRRFVSLALGRGSIRLEVRGNIPSREVWRNGEYDLHSSQQKPIQIIGMNTGFKEYEMTDWRKLQK